MKKILGISLVAMMAVTTARADIASKAYVDQQDALKEAVANKVSKTSGFVEGDYTTTNYPSMATAKAIAEAVSGGANYVVKNNDITAGTHTKITYDAKGLVTGGADLEATDIPNLSLSKITDVTASAAEVNVLDGITASTAELNILDGVTADASELNILDGATLTTTELNYVDGVTSSIQDQLNAKQATSNMVTAKTGNDYTSAAGSTTLYPSMATAEQIAADAVSSAGVGTQITDAIADLDATESQTAGADGLALSITEVDGVITSISGSIAAETYDAYGAASNAVNALGLTNEQATGSGVVTQVTQTNGQIAVTKADPLTTMNYTTLGNDVEGDGVYVLTATASNGNITGYKWEMIERAAQQGGGN